MVSDTCLPHSYIISLAPAGPGLCDFCCKHPVCIHKSLPVGTHQTKDTSQSSLPPPHILLLSPRYSYSFFEVGLSHLAEASFHRASDCPSSIATSCLLVPSPDNGLPEHAESVFDLHLPSAQHDVWPRVYLTLISIYSLLFLFLSFSLQAGKLRIRKDM